MPEFARIQSCSLFWRPQQVDDEKMRGKWRSIILIPSRQKETSVLSFHQHRKYRRNCATTIKSSPPRPPPLHFYDCRAILCTTSFFFILLSYTSVMEAAGRMLSHRYLVNYWKNFCVRYYVCGSSSFGKWAASLKETTSARIIKKKNLDFTGLVRPQHHHQTRIVKTDGFIHCSSWGFSLYMLASGLRQWEAVMAAS